MKTLYHHRIAARDGMDVHKTELIRAFNALGHEVIEVGPGAQTRSEFGSSAVLVDGIQTLAPEVTNIELGHTGLTPKKSRRF